jgi:tRNA(Ile)-lysidine synthase
VRDLLDGVLGYIRKHELIRAGDRVGIAVSGGADSVALLCLMLELRSELGIVLSAVHFNHKLRVEAGEDANFVAHLAEEHGIEFHCDSGDVRLCAKTQHLSLEAAARRLRYAFFNQLLTQGGVNRIATAHTLDDQAETVLLRLIRGAGTQGLAGIYPAVEVGNASIIRPLLGTRRRDVLQFLEEIGQEWREDGSNRDLRFARNRVRHGVLPRLERNLNASVREALAEAAEIARDDEEYWAEEVKRILHSVWTESSEHDGGWFHLSALAALPLALRRRLFRAGCGGLGLRLEFQQVEGLLEVCRNGGPKSANLPDGWMGVRQKDRLGIVAPPESKGEGCDYEYVLPVPGEVALLETGTCLEAVIVQIAGHQRYNPEHLLDRDRIGPQLIIRNWHPGDRFWPGHTKGLRKIKELLQRQHVTGRERKLWPVAVRGDDVMWVRGFPAPTNLQPRDGAERGVLIREVIPSGAMKKLS